jgi:hypothetical protein
MKSLFTAAVLSVGLAFAATAPASAEPGYGRDGGHIERGHRDGGPRVDHRGPRDDFRGPRDDFREAGHRHRHHWRKPCHWERVCWRNRWGERRCRMERVCRPRWY